MKYMLITVCERDIYTETLKDAREYMLEELEREVADSSFEYSEDAWDNIASKNEYADVDMLFAFGKDYAWSNCDDDWHYDWKIVEI